MRVRWSCGCSTRATSPTPTTSSGPRSTCGCVRGSRASSIQHAVSARSLRSQLAGQHTSWYGGNALTFAASATPAQDRALDNNYYATVCARCWEHSIGAFMLLMPCLLLLLSVSLSLSLSRSADLCSLSISPCLSQSRVHLSFSPCSSFIGPERGSASLLPCACLIIPAFVRRDADVQPVSMGRAAPALGPWCVAMAMA